MGLPPFVKVQIGGGKPHTHAVWKQGCLPYLLNRSSHCQHLLSSGQLAMSASSSHGATDSVS